MDERSLHALLAADDADHWEYPPNFNYQKSLHRVREVQPILEELAENKLTIDDQVQDASYFASLSITESIDNKHRREVFALYFSCFGSLVAVWNEDVLSPAKIKLIKNVLDMHGLVALDGDQLQTQYTGLHKAFIGRTWIDRFFNYV